MTAGELRELLNGIPDDTRVAIRISRFWWRWAELFVKDSERVEVG